MLCRLVCVVVKYDREGYVVNEVTEMTSLRVSWRCHQRYEGRQEAAVVIGGGGQRNVTRGNKVRGLQRQREKKGRHLLV